MSTHTNYTYINTVCPECKHNIILRDNVREETYCTKCGLIIMDNTIPSITTEIRRNKENIRLKKMQKLWKTFKFTGEGE